MEDKIFLLFYWASNINKMIAGKKKKISTKTLKLNKVKLN